MSISTVEIRAFSGPDLVELGSAGRPTIIRLNVGPKGDAGNAATVAVGTTTTGSAGTNASVTNSGTTSAAVFNFTIPRGDTGETGATGAAGPNSVTSATTSDGTAILDVESITGLYIDGDVFTATSGTGTAVSGGSNSGVGAIFYSQNNYGAIIGSAGGTALQLNLVSGDYYLECYNNFTTIEAAIERVRGWFVWFYNTFTGRLKTADITADRDWTLPDASGNVALTASTTGVPDKLADGTIAGTTTFNSTSYTYGTGAAAAHRTALGVSASGDTVLRSSYTPAHSLLVQQSGTGSPSSLSVGNNTILGRASGGGSQIAALSGSDARSVLGLSTLATTTPAANVATFLETPTSANLAAAVTDETGSGSLVFATSPTIDAPTISGSAAFTSTTRPTSAGTGTPAAMSLITRADFDQRIITGMLNMWAWPVQGTTFTNVIGSGDFNGGISLFCGAIAASSLARFTGASQPPYASLGTAGLINWGSPIYFSFIAYSGAIASSGINRVYLGLPHSSTTVQDLNIKGVGIKTIGSSIFFQVFGASLVTSASSVGTLTSLAQSFLITGDGTGTYNLFINGVLASTLSGGPTGTSADASNRSIQAMCSTSDTFPHRLTVNGAKLWL
jgi:hypothetical protein